MKYVVIVLFFAFLFEVHANERSLLIGAQQLLSKAEYSGVIIIDVRDRASYLRSHIKNAINLPVSETFSKGKRTDLVAPLSKIIKLFGSSGIKRTSQVILYDDGVFIDAARLFWVLETFGNEQVSILNMGFNQWIDNKYPLSSVETKLDEVTFIPSISPNRATTYLSVRSIIDDPNHYLVDVRPKDEYLGLKSITGEYGHIPTAINIPFTENLDSESAYLLNKKDLSNVYSQFDKSKLITVYCNKGKQSALSYFALRHLGYSVSAYDGSWFEWGSMQNLPKWTP